MAKLYKYRVKSRSALKTNIKNKQAFHSTHYWKELSRLFRNKLYKSVEKRLHPIEGGPLVIIREKIKSYFLFEQHHNNSVLSEDVYHRLILRHVILSDLEKLEDGYKINDHLKEVASKSPACCASDKSDNKQGVSHPSIRGYRLATTDLFVEKAIAYLEIDYNMYMKKGNRAFIIGITIISTGTIVALIQVFSPDNHVIDSINLWGASIKFHTDDWRDFVVSFSRGFTFYGLLVLTAVGSWRYGKAMLDQAERLRERRHALRQGRLFVHLNNGTLSIEELEKAFDWNVSKGNAFGNLQTEASAPWGGVIKELIKAIPEIFKRTKDQVKS